MKITEDKIERICDLRYNGGKVIPIALNEKLSEKTVRTILKKFYATYAKIRVITQPDYPPWGYLPLNGKPTATIQETSNQGDTHQDTNYSAPEH